MSRTLEEIIKDSDSETVKKAIGIAQEIISVEVKKLEGITTKIKALQNRL